MNDTMNYAKHYTVGWICAVEAERVAAEAFLDENIGVPDQVSKNDNNSYTLGKMGNHYVVIASLPIGDYGTVSAASVARDMLHSFPNVRIGLMVGLGGGVPSQDNDIRLGDVVVSSPKDGTGGVFQYDYGESIQNGNFKQTGHLNQPPPVLGTAVAGLSASHVSKGNGLDNAINSVMQKWPRLQRKYTRPKSADQLFRSDVVHSEGGRECCKKTADENKSKLVPRDERMEYEDNPAIHYGLIASGNTLMKDALKRDEIAGPKKVLCFEMEAAGLMNHFPCIVIRGICDYADSHGNSEWHGYASMTAAAYAKTLLQRISLSSIEVQARISAVAQISNSVPKSVPNSVTITIEESDAEGKEEEERVPARLTENGEDSDDITAEDLVGRGQKRDHDFVPR